MNEMYFRVADIQKEMDSNQNLPKGMNSNYTD